MKNYQKGFVTILAWIIVALVIAGFGGYLYVKRQSVSSPTNTVTASTTDIKIYSISQTSVPVGTQLVLKGNFNEKDFGGPEFATQVVIQNSNGQKAVQELMPTDNTATFTLSKEMCGNGKNAASGLPCDAPVIITPGVYTIYYENLYLKKVSNSVTFTVTGSGTSVQSYTDSKNGFSLQYPLGTTIATKKIDGGTEILFTLPSSSSDTLRVDVIPQEGVNVDVCHAGNKVGYTDVSINNVMYVKQGIPDKYCTVKNGNAYYISIDNNNLDIVPALRQMFFSFTLVTTNSDLETYINTQYGFSLQYPQGWHIEDGSRFDEVGFNFDLEMCPDSLFQNGSCKYEQTSSQFGKSLAPILVSVLVNDRTGPVVGSNTTLIKGPTYNYRVILNDISYKNEYDSVVTSFKLTQ